MAQSGRKQTAMVFKASKRTLIALLGCVVASGALLPAARAAAQMPGTAIAFNPAGQASGPRGRTLTPHSKAAATQQVQIPATPAAPPAPDWPVNDRPGPATVVWNSQGLRIEASNSSLAGILKEVATETGAKVEGMSADQRIFGTYGPGPARDVLAQLLEGSGYNLLLAGDEGQGTPREIILSTPSKEDAQAQGDNQPAPGIKPPDIADQQQPDPGRPGFGIEPGTPISTPEEIMQQMQERQQETQQMMQRQMQLQRMQLLQMQQRNNSQQ